MENIVVCVLKFRILKGYILSPINVLLYTVLKQLDKQQIVTFNFYYHFRPRTFRPPRFRVRKLRCLESEASIAESVDVKSSFSD